MGGCAILQSNLGDDGKLGIPRLAPWQHAPQCPPSLPPREADALSSLKADSDEKAVTSSEGGQGWGKSQLSSLFLPFLPSREKKKLISNRQPTPTENAQQRSSI